MTKIYAHRGSSGTHPENTLAAFEEAIRSGADGIELDIQFTKDKEIVVIHDYTLDRTTSGSGKVLDHTLDEIKQFDAGGKFSPKFAGEKIPTLREVLELLKDTDLEVNVEIKSPFKYETGIEEKMLQELRQFEMMDRIVISSFNHEVLKRVHELEPGLECAILYMKKMEQPWDYASSIGSKALHTYDPETDSEMIAEAQDKGFPVRVFTVNSDDGIKRLLNANVAAIITDFPEKALEIKKNYIVES